MKQFQKWLLVGSSLATGVTGIVYFWMKRFLVSEDPFVMVGHPLEPWLLKAHILTAPVLLFALGLVTMDHVWKNYRCLVPAGRRSGIAATGVIVPMVATGYLIQVTTSIGWLSALGWTHLGAGVFYLLSLLLHQRVFRKRASIAAATVPARRPREVGPQLPNTSQVARSSIGTGTERASKGS